MKSYSNFTDAYTDILKDVYTTPEFSSSPRGLKIKEILGYQFRITNPLNRIPYVSGRDLSAHYLIAELIWYLSGNNSTEWISNYSSFWSKITDDGKTANSAYGARIFKPHDRIASTVDETWTQWKYVINELKLDQDSRRAVIHIRSPHDSILAGLDVPCTLTLQFFLRNDKLYMITSMRSSDVILGLSYDVPAFTIFQELLALELSSALGKQIGLGDYIHLSSSLHVYERHFKMVEKILDGNKSSNLQKPLEMPKMPNKPPLDDLLEFERKVRNVQSSSEVLHLLSNLVLPDYWKDWCKVIASHKAMKLGDNLLSNNLLSSTTFEGYRYFSEK